MNNIVPNKKCLAIIDAVCYWLGYQFKIGREQLIHEASLRYPIADTLTSQEIQINQIVLEKLHPIFMSKKIDLVVIDDCIKNTVNEFDIANINEVYEFKLAKCSTGKIGGEEHQRVLDDIVRLAYFHMWEQKDCYFLMCGKYEDFLTYFVGQPTPTNLSNHKNTVIQRTKQSLQENAWVPQGIYKDWFKFEIEKSVGVEFDNNDQSFGLSKFQANYKIRPEINKKFTDNVSIKTTCLGITPYGGINRTHAAGIWKVEGLCK